MQPRTNEFGQPIGPALPEWKGVPRPALSALEGRTVRIEALSAERHAEELFEAFQLDKEGQSWTYLFYGPFATRDALGRWIEELCASPEAISFALIEKESGRACGFCSYLRVFPEFGSIEIGNVQFFPAPTRHARSDRSDAPLDEARLRPRLPALRVEV